jgi:hypothetical protein
LDLLSQTVFSLIEQSLQIPDSRFHDAATEFQTTEFQTTEFQATEFQATEFQMTVEQTYFDRIFIPLRIAVETV